MVDIIEKLTLINRTVRNNRNIWFIVIHYTGNVTDKAISNANYFYDTNRGASAHYFVDEESIVQVVRDKDEAWAVNRNYGTNNLFGTVNNNNSISIEMCSTNGAIAERTIKNTIDLVKTLMKKYNIPVQNVYRHYDVCTKNCPGWAGWGMLDGDSKWVNFKNRLVENTKQEPVIINTQKQYPIDVNGHDFPHYRVHQSKIGWNYVTPIGQGAGCLHYQIEGLKIDNPNTKTYVVAHIQKVGTTNYGLINKNTVIGTVGRKLRLEGLWIQMEGYKARAFCGDEWLPWQKCDGKSLIGTTGKSLPMYSIQFEKDK